MDKRVLIIEDEASINDILSRALSKEGYIIKSAYTGEEALEHMKDFKPHLVLLDIMLPDTTGFELAKRISNNSYVIMITARNEISDKLKCM
ncbi:DNA-binding response OmpR family regulator [Clostridium sardiniense]|nr:DNA-binding response OmpR family regulator [Clostridium sardiniense]